MGMTKKQQTLTENGFTPEYEAEILNRLKNFEVGTIIESKEDIKKLFSKVEKA